MKLFTISSLAVCVVFIIAACHTSKKSTTSSTATTNTNSTSTPSTASTSTTVSTYTLAAGVEGPMTPAMYAERAGGIYEPGDAELNAINLTYKDVTLEKLKEGHKLYTGSTCTRCHGKASIYQIPNEHWPDLLTNMAFKAGIGPDQKDAILKYVLAIKAAKK